ncbi:MAG: hypothetical protein PHP75_07090 [Methylacidiphilaceae bacterium]|nr:hypothetical protein [Candidatus Methylacidiphilaceae bacterium]
MAVVPLSIHAEPPSTKPAIAAAAKKKNWTPPSHKILAQLLSDRTMAEHPELLSVTFHGVPPGMDKVYTMFAGSFPERIGNPDDPDDIDVITKGITIVDPRWHRTKDNPKKFVVMLPLRDKNKENIGLVVYAFKLDTNPGKGEREFFAEALDLRDALSEQIPSYEALFTAPK